MKKNPRVWSLFFKDGKIINPQLVLVLFDEMLSSDVSSRLTQYLEKTDRIGSFDAMGVRAKAGDRMGIARELSLDLWERYLDATKKGRAQLQEQSKLPGRLGKNASDDLRILTLFDSKTEKTIAII